MGFGKKVINFAWISNEPAGSQWPHPFYTNSAIIASVQSGDTQDSAIWYTETRNIKQDLKTFFDLDTGQLRGIGLMTDCDNTGAGGIAWYRNIRLSFE